ncbi:hypothetical protein TBLA_0B04160 [Henningerozyma blattae CBS 6284]|uniref:Pyridoxamine kinase/Phosphomethylpyrimidine kinase domain-containing protein n=1 Tax=Henningerozyma blattae (strain ATCC 34711 / CBS 6284 / DSM 70876 / NBRC 10599 / NRRL Y-10934 / UCD 77-7) TaxID=1071380 RepID=I2GYQ2_HENB6|nr:hypothetical protein TBLA_0B04160 [Tetrapisispora blattae CBS 6284]CCH59254.1 hypothetical protein TBLA_0B04160 [Tetrapisispora blattae CBS 6284]
MTKTFVKVNTPPPYLTLSEHENLPSVLTIAGSDSSGGAGIEADLKTITAHRCYAMTCITAITVQTPSKVYDVHKISKDSIKEILDVNLNSMKCDVIKCGMLTIEAAEALNEKLIQLGDKKPKLVVDPLLSATSGKSFSGATFVDILKEIVTPFADLITPNIPEALKLVGKTDYEISSMNDIVNIAQEVSQVTKCKNVLIKGGHLPFEYLTQHRIVDVLYLSEEEKFITYQGHLANTSNTHGTGCTLASAIACNIASGYSLQQSVYGGIEYVQNSLTIGCEVANEHIKSNGPINHVYAVEVPMEKMIADDCFESHVIMSEKQLSNIICKSVDYKTNFFEFLISHPYVKPHWETYINHEFVKQVANGTLHPKKFQFFIEQDYTYLVDYARIHCLAASKSPSLKDIEDEIIVIKGVRHEIATHQEKLSKYFGIEDKSYYSKIQRGRALNNYSRYFKDIAKRGTWEELVAALTPCLMGYGYALIIFKNEIQLNKTYPYYHSWCLEYLSESHVIAMSEGLELLNHIASTYPPEKIDTLVKIYGDVCKLETQFWDAALNYSE